MPNIKLRSSDDEVFVVDAEVAKCSITIATMLSDLGDEDGNEEEIPVAGVKGKTLKKILKWAEHHHKKHSKFAEGEMGSNVEEGDWEAKFMKNLDHSTIFDLFKAADFLEIKELMDILSTKVAKMLTGKSSEEMRAVVKVRQEYEEVVMLCEKSVPHVMLKSSDGMRYGVDANIARMIPKLNVNEESLKKGSVFPLPMAYSACLEKVIEWLKQHKDDAVEAAGSEEEENQQMSEYDKNFLQNLENPCDFMEMFSLVEKLGIENLQKLLLLKLQKMFEEKTIEEMRTFFNFRNDFDPGQLERIQKENSFVEKK